MKTKANGIEEMAEVTQHPFDSLANMKMFYKYNG